VAPILAMVDNPVTHTADADKNIASYQERDSSVTVVNGSLSNNAPMVIIPKKLNRIIIKGETFFLFINAFLS
jgi:hypothetical protein